MQPPGSSASIPYCLAPEFIFRTYKTPIERNPRHIVFLPLPKQCGTLVRDTGSGVAPSKRPKLSEPQFPYLHSEGSKRVANIFPVLSLCLH